MAPRKSITTSQRIILRKYAREHRELRQTQLREWFQTEFGQKISQSSISESLSAKFVALDQPEDVRQPEQKRRRIQHHPELEEALYKWLKDPETKPSESLSDAKLHGYAIKLWTQMYPDIEVPGFSSGWAFGFKKRYGLGPKKTRGNNGLTIVDNPQAIDALLKEYRKGDIYSFAETRLFWKHTPDQTISTKKEENGDTETENFNGTTEGTRKNAYISPLLCCNGDGSDKSVPWLVGHVTRPKCFDAANVNPDSFRWHAGPDASPTVETMKEWFEHFEDHVVYRGRKVLLVMQDSGPAREAAQILAHSSSLKTITIFFCPADSVGQFLPFQHGIVSSFKSHYRKRWLQYMADEYYEGRDPEQTTNVLKAIQWIWWAWNDVPAATISGAWVSAGLSDIPVISGNNSSDKKSPDALAIEQITLLVSKLFQEGRIHSIAPIETFVNPEEENVTSVHSSVPENAVEVSKQEENDENVEVIPLISHRDALTHIEALFIYEQQQNERATTGIEILSKYESQVSQRRQQDLK